MGEETVSVDVDTLIASWLNYQPAGKDRSRGDVLAEMLLCNKGSLNVPPLGSGQTKGPSGHMTGLTDEQIVVFAQMSGALQGWTLMGIDVGPHITNCLRCYMDRVGIQYKIVETMGVSHALN